MKTETVSLKGERKWQGIPAIERAGNGRLWCAFYGGGDKEPAPDNRIFITSRSGDSKVWSEPAVALSGEGDTRVYDPCLWHDPEGKLWLFYNSANLLERKFSLMEINAENSSLDFLQWSGPREIKLDVPFIVRLNKPIVLSTGEWILPVTWAEDAPEKWFPEPGKQLQGVAVSADYGLTWRLHGKVEAPHWALENMVVELEDRRLWMLIRAGGGVLWESFSMDRGRTWSTGSPTEIRNPGTRFFIGNLSSGRMILINTFNHKERKGIEARFKDGCGKAKFSEGIELDPREKVSYPDAVEGGDGLIYTVHDRDRYGTGEIILSIFSEEEMLEKVERARNNLNKSTSE